MKKESSDWIEVKGNYTWFKYDLIKAFNKRIKEINMTEQTIKFRDPVVQCVVNKFVDRSDVGFAKYGKTLRDDKSDLFAWANHLQEELMDAVLYMQRLKEELTDLQQEAMINRVQVNYELVDVKKDKYGNYN